MPPAALLDRLGATMHEASAGLSRLTEADLITRLVRGEDLGFYRKLDRTGRVP